MQTAASVSALPPGSALFLVRWAQTFAGPGCFSPLSLLSSLLSQQRTWRKSRPTYLSPASVRCLTRRWWVWTVSTHLWRPFQTAVGGIFRRSRLYLHFMSRASTALLLPPVKSMPQFRLWWLAPPQLSLSWDQSNASGVGSRKSLNASRPTPLQLLNNWLVTLLIPSPMTRVVPPGWPNALNLPLH